MRKTFRLRRRPVAEPVEDIRFYAVAEDGTLREGIPPHETLIPYPSDPANPIVSFTPEEPLEMLDRLARREIARLERRGT